MEAIPPSERGAGLLRVGRMCDLGARAACVAARRTQWGDVRFADEVEGLLDREVRAPSRAGGDALFACILHILRSDEASLDALSRIARDRALPTMTLLLGPGAQEAHRALAPRGRLPDASVPRTARLLTSRVVTWIDTESSHDDERRVVRRETVHVRPEHAHVREQASRLARHHDPFTIGRFLEARATSLADAVRVAARRPSTPALVRELVARDRWMTRVEVRAALAANPFTPTRLARLLVVTCGPQLRRVDGMNLDETVRATIALWTRVDRGGVHTSA